MRLRRVWPWRRDDRDPERNAWLNEFYRLSVCFGSIVAIEMGAALVQLTAVPWFARLAIYALFAALLLWQRPALRSREFWQRLPDWGRMPHGSGSSTKES